MIVTNEYAEAIAWLNEKYPDSMVLRAKDIMKVFDVGITTARETCKKYGLKIGDPCIPKPVIATMIAAKMKIGSQRV